MSELEDEASLELDEELDDDRLPDFFSEADADAFCSPLWLDSPLLSAAAVGAAGVEAVAAAPAAFFFRGFFLRLEATNRSSALRVDGFSVSKSISISSGLESRRAASRDWMICTTRPSLSPAI